MVTPTVPGLSEHDPEFGGDQQNIRQYLHGQKDRAMEGAEEEMPLELEDRFREYNSSSYLLVCAIKLTSTQPPVVETTSGTRHCY